MKYTGSFLNIDNQIREIYEEGANPVPILKLEESNDTDNEYYNNIGIIAGMFKYFSEYNFIRLKEKENIAAEDNFEFSGEILDSIESPEDNTPENFEEEFENEEEEEIIFKGKSKIKFFCSNDEDLPKNIFKEISNKDGYLSGYENVEICFHKDDFTVVETSSLFSENNSYLNIPISHIFLQLNTEETEIENTNETENTEETETENTDESFGKKIYMSSESFPTEDFSEYAIGEKFPYSGAPYVLEEKEYYDSKGLKMKPNLPYFRPINDLKQSCLVTYDPNVYNYVYSGAFINEGEEEIMLESTNEYILKIYFPYVDEEFKSRLFNTNFSDITIEFKFENDVFFSNQENSYTACCNFLYENHEEEKEVE